MKQECPARMNEQQRAQLFELWKRAPFPEIASAVDSFMQGAADQYTSGGGADGSGKTTGPPYVFESHG